MLEADGFGALDLGVALALSGAAILLCAWARLLLDVVRVRLVEGHFGDLLIHGSLSHLATVLTILKNSI